MEAIFKLIPLAAVFRYQTHETYTASGIKALCFVYSTRAAVLSLQPSFYREECQSCSGLSAMLSTG